MNYYITNFQIKVLKWLAKKVVIQSNAHKDNIITYYRILAKAAQEEFREDTKYTLDAFLIECHKASLEGN